MMTALDPSKTKIAKRVIEVFEFFDDHNRTATVMDIVRRYGRPQSSTSELLGSLVEMGFLYKDPRSRAYSPTPRLAALGSSAQPEIIRRGRLFEFMDRLAGSTRCSVALFGMVGTHAQIFRMSSGESAPPDSLGCGYAELLSATTAGLLLLSAVAPDQARRMLWRLNAEAPPEKKFNLTELVERVAAFRRLGHAAGAAGFVPDAQLLAALLPKHDDERPLALGVIYRTDAGIDADALLSTLRRGVARCALADDFGETSVARLRMAV